MTDTSESHSMVIVRLMGGLGNQLFQYALGRRLAMANDAHLMLDASGYGTGGSPDPMRGTRVCELSNYRLMAQIADNPESDSRGWIPVTRWIRKARQTATRLADRRKPYYLRHEIVEPESMRFRFDRRVVERKFHGTLSVRGFWQCEPYCRGIEAILRQELRPRREPEPRNAALAERLVKEDSVAIHLRHGDNANEVASDLGVLPLSYYERALAEIRIAVADPKFYVFSDDIAWAREFLGGQSHLTFVDHNSAQHSHEDLRLMSHCQHHILANSTFGWWGAWLGKHAGQIVIAPRRYYLGIDRPNPDLYPQDWRLL